MIPTLPQLRESLKYLLKHKYYVMCECFKLGLFKRGLLHDLSKFLPSEFIPYTNFFYNPDGSRKQIRDATGYYKPDDTGDEAFDYAWLLHQKRNMHHWQWWILPKDDGTTKVFPMQKEYLLEMLCDWKGAGKAQGIKMFDRPWDETRAWFLKNNHKMTFHPQTKKEIYKLLLIGERETKDAFLVTPKLREKFMRNDESGRTIDDGILRAETILRESGWGVSRGVITKATNVDVRSHTLRDQYDARDYLLNEWDYAMNTWE